MDAVKMQLTTSMAMISMKHSMQVSLELMRDMNSLMRTQDIAAMMEDMRQEMARCSDADNQIEEAFHNEEDDEEVAMEVQRVLEEFELDQLGVLASLPSTTPTIAPAYAASRVRQPAGG